MSRFHRTVLKVIHAKTRRARFLTPPRRTSRQMIASATAATSGTSHGCCMDTPHCPVCTGASQGVVAHTLEFRPTVRRNVRSHRPRRKDRHGAAPEDVRRGTAVAQASRRRDAMRDIQPRATAGRSEFQPASFADLLRGYRFRVCTDRVAFESALDVRRRIYLGHCGYDVPVPDEYDPRSWLLLAEHVGSGEVVGTMRITPRSAGPHELLAADLRDIRQRREHPLWEFVFTTSPAEILLPPPTARFGPVRYLGARPVSFAATE